jgi:glucose-specific phosphotransferase system IIA component
VLLVSPVPGTVRALSAVPDRVFAGGMVGPGVAVEPVRTAVQHVVAPVDGVVAALHPHAFALRVSDDRSVLVHLGVDTVTLAGAGFEVHVVAGQHVRAGERVVTWSPVDVAAAGLSTICPVVALQAAPDDVALLLEPGETVAAGQPLLEWVEA